ncbi:MAG: ankyrin repeat domain-containing protein [Spirochaetales bacterium]|nr:ankyrin repeat domain-containing protein [Spirochaetales bacterium]
MKFRFVIMVLICTTAVSFLSADTFDKYSEPSKMYMFIEAVSKMQIDDVKYMIPKIKDINASNSSGSIAIVEAAGPMFSTDSYSEEQRKKMIALLVSGGADVNRQDARGATALGRAAEHEYIEIVEFLLDKKAEVNKKDNYGISPLYWALQKKNEKLIEIFVTHGADINIRDSLGNTPLLLALIEKDRNLAVMLINAGADLQSKNKNGLSILQAAVKLGDKKFLELLLSRGVKTDKQDRLLYIAMDAGEYDLFLFLLEKNADPDEQWRDGEPLLIHSLRMAAEVPDWRKNELRYVRALLDHDADVNVIGNTSDTALLLALKSGDADVIRAIYKKTKNAAQKGEYRRTALMLAAEYGDSTLVKDIAAKAGGVNEKDDFGWTPLMYAANKEIMDFLVSKKAVLGSVNTADETGTFPLFFTIEKGNAALARQLLDAGANVNQVMHRPGWNGVTPLIMAAGLDKREIAQLLLERKAVINQKDSDGMTALDYAGPETRKLLVSLGGK